MFRAGGIVMAWIICFLIDRFDLIIQWLISNDLFNCSCTNTLLTYQLLQGGKKGKSFRKEYVRASTGLFGESETKFDVGEDPFSSGSFY